MATHTTQHNALALKERKKQQVNDAIIEAARSLFVKHGYENTAMQDIADAAGISRASLFNYYPGKPALLSALVDDMNQRFHVLIEEQRAQSGSTQDKLCKFIVYSSSVIEKSQAFSRVLFTAFWQSIENPLEKRMALLQLTASFRGLLADGIRQGEVRTDISLDVLAQMVTAAFTSLTNHWMNDPLYPLSRTATEVALYVCDSISPRSGTHPHQGPRHEA